jgi:hypothetical protein
MEIMEWIDFADQAGVKYAGKIWLLCCVIAWVSILKFAPEDILGYDRICKDV